ncbi:UDP-N-acetylmuramoyl-tripeptide--D-alanyl-D-alanine ligase [Sphingomonadales bacterium 56]|uniref:UDP-N-acetylmuramoyl-tripeptide--D-alanyl-D- alanine ligase n=1 Tax=unclassified Sphingobium TaxID=2611147 RepID=UPI00191969BE|nr:MULTISPECIES: UDP-N-acetylmuramoyl-tripeptide--D-alanyl-D-alanine ligase [unclassified Sphingobium]MBY2928478.1 UDP-N-acetylmuramoyl-tripeptide--D-alanyl-D-alanine ligase [Sphingomonadales bacterium 56]MBY2959674.1 UDP-N-acetylmuramoyl-tripeptide--D-alanyl-D-alanine ligase [Sphingomonadales bacterium 58]CAD7337391.1 UDP-N-acetylmuramoyl-tripeptide--D-alanyl-D-alanine ligase [Sphingobium sp. S6]CAD7339467.1 UDP-N-acetylmuramoyl-tripeptide--D-alanyl-D-alanine ligase [Sphingobium sp. S8]
MSDLWTSEEIAQATGGVASAPFAVSGVAFDSREVTGGDLFVAMKGETTDGHRFIDKAFGQGAAGAIVSEPVSQPHILVPDSAAALEALGRASRARMQGKVVGVTGSVGKTGTKEALFHALDRICPDQVHRSVKSYNNHVGVPLSLSRMPRASAFGVFEMGMNHAGELAQLTRQVRPHVAIVTAIAPAHIEFFGTEEKIAEAKAEIFEGLEPDGTAVIPYDSPHVATLYAKAEQHAARILTFGFDEEADVRARDMVPAANGGTLVTAALPSAELCFTVGAPGEHWVSNALAVLAAVEALGGDLAAAGLALAELPGLPGRGERRMIAVAGGEALLIDESYNANPLSMAATLKQLGKEDASRRIAVLGGMRELGDRSYELHAGLAEPLATGKVDYAILVGDEMTPLADTLQGQRLAFAHVPDTAAATNLIQTEMRAGDAILVKGSNGIGLSRLVAALGEHKN